MRLYLIALVLALVALACKKEPDAVSHGVFIWNERSSYDFLDTAEQDFIKDYNVRKIYYKFCDVVWDDHAHAHPIDIRYMPNNEALYTFLEIVPCLFFTNEVMLKSTHEELAYMAERIAQRLAASARGKEVLMDCDWSEHSKTKYFYFLEQLKAHLKGKTLTVTLRLYQHKYPDKAGLPPADRALLMLYNFRSPQTLTEDNTIFDKQEAAKYISNKAYSLPLDFALPSFSWSILYNAEGKFLGFVKNSAIAQDQALFRPLKPQVYLSLADTVVNNVYLRKGNMLKLEQIGKKELEEAHTLIASFKNTSAYTLSVFDLNENTMTLINTDANETIFKKYHP